MQAGFDGAQGDVKDLGGLGERHVVVVAEEQEKALLGLEMVEGGAERVEVVVRGRGGIGTRTRFVGVFSEAEDRADGGLLCGAKVVAAVDDDAVKPGLDGGAGLERVGGADDAEPGVLNNVGGELLARAEEAGGESKERGFKALGEFTKRGTIAAGETPQEREVGVGGRVG